MLNKHYERLLQLEITSRFEGINIRSAYNDDYENFTSRIQSAHEAVIRYLCQKACGKETENLFNTKNILKSEAEIDDSVFIDIPKIEEIHIGYLNTSYKAGDNGLETKKTKNHSKYSGAFYTPKSITQEIIDNVINRKKEDITGNQNIKVLDFACGTGNFSIELIEAISKITNRSAKKVIEQNIYAFDIDFCALMIFKSKLIKKYFLDSGLIEINNALSNIQKLDFINDDPTLQNLFSESNNFNILQNKFDIIVSNPPYLNLKFNNKSKEPVCSEAQYLQKLVQATASKIRSSGSYPLSSRGMLNLYRASIEKMLNLASHKAQIGIICPSSIFADKSAVLLRKELLTRNNIQKIKYYREDALLFGNVTQSTAIMLIEKGVKTKSIEVSLGPSTFNSSLEDIELLSPDSLEIPIIDSVGWSIIKRISKISTIKHIEFVRNKRGELDLTLHKKFITNTKTSHHLIRGVMLKKNGIERKNEYVDIDSFIQVKSDDYIKLDLNKERLVCNQISSVDSQKRLKFLKCAKSDIIGNSCNYISILDESANLDFYLKQLNSCLLDWVFRIRSSNNHVNNYEIDSLPLISHRNLNSKKIREVISYDEAAICNFFGLTDAETKYIIEQYS